MDEQDKEIIMNAVLKGNLENVQDTLKKHLLVMDESFFDYQLLRAALCRKHHAITNFLLDEGCRIRNPKEISLKEESLLHLAVKLNNEIIIKKMLLKGASIYDKDHEGNMPICVALKLAHFCAVDEILNYRSSLKNLNPYNEADVIHFHVALVANKISVVAQFLAYGFDINGLLNIKVLTCYLHKLQMVKNYLGSTQNYCLISLVKYLKDISLKVTILQLEILLNSGKSVQFLLYNGADVNIEDSKGNSIISLINWKHNSDNSRMAAKYVVLFGIIFGHVQKLLALKLYVSEKVHKFCNQLYPLYRATLILSIPYGSAAYNAYITYFENILDNCQKELDRMKLTKIDNYTSLYNILLKDPHELSKYVKNNSLIEIIDFKNIYRNFPLYSYLLKMQFYKGLNRRNVLEFAKASLNHLIGLNLPDLCYDLIMKHLTNKEIINLRVASHLKDYLKEKIK